ncbi:unnamed protein product [Acanthoscelides obtectus]|uniref:Uncharacterized protein n=1 Tax=Acanthoscelides obtectus TaxID=200917 RepID=A0A9P0JP94_ACAOB|nr:unnamed protein product [Acanthoscelides obtectus]CAK1678909.1 hypothetical protein AOBTE_LOCUS32064 [Acanthoscelides obtectus]
MRGFKHGKQANDLFKLTIRLKCLKDFKVLNK